MEEITEIPICTKCDGPVKLKLVITGEIEQDNNVPIERFSRIWRNVWQGYCEKCKWHEAWWEDIKI